MISQREHPARSAGRPLARRSSRRATALSLVIAALGFAGCKVHDGGGLGPATGQPSSIDPETATGTGGSKAGAGGSPVSNAGSGGTGGQSAPVATGGTSIEPPPVPAADAAVAEAGTSDVSPGSPPPDGGPSVDPMLPPVVADTCAPAGGFLDVSIQTRIWRAEDFTFDHLGRMLAFQDRDIVIVPASDFQREELLVRNVGGFQGGAVRALADGDLLIADYSGDELVRLDPNGQRRDRITMPLRSPRQLAAVPGSATVFYVTTQDNHVHRVDAANGEMTQVLDATFRIGGIAVDGERKRLYLGVLGNGAVHAYPIGPRGELGAPTQVAEAVPQPTALALDACGGLYIGGAEGGAIRRLSPAGAVSVVARSEARDITALAFGSGKNGWSAQSLYALDTFNGRLLEIRVRTK